MAKGFDGYIWITPEDKGWDGTSSLLRGNFLFADSESLAINKDIRERPNKITYGRVLKASTRVLGKQAPGGDIEFQFRSDDLPMILMAHFQKYIGTSFALGSCQYTFVPEKGVPNSTGSAFGTGSYTSAAGDLYTMGALQRFFTTSANNGTNAQWYKSCIVNEIEIKLDVGDDAKMKASLVASRVDAGTPVTLNPTSALGSYSTKPSFEHWSGTILWDGGTTELNKFQLVSKNNLEDRNIIGKINPVNYRFGRYEIEGSLELDMPYDGLKYFGSQMSGSSFTVVGTLYNSGNDWVAFNLPNCRFKPFEAQVKGGEAVTTFTLPFKSYESEDGGTAPITMTVQTTTWGSTPIIRL
jgi:hypothetical protein